MGEDRGGTTDYDGNAVRGGNTPDETYIQKPSDAAEAAVEQPIFFFLLLLAVISDTRPSFQPVTPFPPSVLLFTTGYAVGA